MTAKTLNLSLFGFATNATVKPIQDGNSVVGYKVDRQIVGPMHDNFKDIGKTYDKK